jgi:hypothetical protein
MRLLPRDRTKKYRRHDKDKTRHRGKTLDKTWEGKTNRTKIRTTKGLRQDKGKGKGKGQH